MENIEASEHGKELSRLGASKGGKARAKALTPEERSAIARNAVQTRWEKAGVKIETTPKATHTGTLKIGTIELQCFVLDNKEKTRVLSGRALTNALGLKGRGQGVGRFLASKSLKPYIDQELVLAIEEPLKFLTGGLPSFGYDATVLPALCSAILDAAFEKQLPSQQRTMADQARILARAFSKVGIIALVDEATGFQDTRSRDALAKILEAFIRKELREWVRTFPPDFYKELFRLWNLPFPTDKVKKPSFIGKLTNNIIYERLAPGVLDELRAKNPRNASGNRSARHHQWLTEDIGHPKLLQHLASVIALMKVSENKETFMKMLNKALPKQVDLPLLKDIGAMPS